MAKKTTQDAKIRREEKSLKVALEAFPTNPIPWPLVIRVVAPIVARLAIRYALKRLNRTMSEDKVNRAADTVAEHIGEIIDRRMAEGSNG